MRSRSRKQELTVAQRVAIRQLHDYEAPGLHQSTLNALERRGLVAPPNADNDYRLTAVGEQAYQEIMASGDGPEDLKELLRF